MKKTNDENKSFTTRKQEEHAPFRRPGDEESDIFQKILKQCEIPLLYYVLKTTTDEEHAMSISEISEQLDLLIPPPNPNDNYFPERTLRRKIDRLTALQDNKNPLLQSVNQLLQMILGGQIEYCEANGILSGKNIHGKGTQRRYYFNPILTSGDMNMIFGSIQSNRYLSEDEKNYLLTRLRLLEPSFDYSDDTFTDNRYRHIYQIDTLAAKPATNTSTNLPVDASKLLSHIQIIHDAIQDNHQIKVIYGIYDIKENSNKVMFRPRNAEKAYTLNPYALLWNDGEYYLIATHGKYTNPVHFRIDRILSVVPHTQIDSNGYKHYMKRAKVPSTLAPFFHKRKGQAPVFDAIKYTNQYPGMRIYHKSNLIDCCFECTPQSLQILIDFFGPNLRLGESAVEHKSLALDSSGKPQKYLTATVQNIQYENALGFCIQNAQHLTLLSPPNLVEDVKKTLSSIIERYHQT